MRARYRRSASVTSEIMIGASEHVLVTDKGCEILAKTPHTLHFA